MAQYFDKFRELSPDIGMFEHALQCRFGVDVDVHPFKLPAMQGRPSWGLLIRTESGGGDYLLNYIRPALEKSVLFTSRLRNEEYGFKPTPYQPGKF